MRALIFRTGATVGVLALLFAPGVLAQEGSKPPAKRLAAELFFNKRLIPLGLTVQQKGRIHGIFTEHEDALSGKLAAYIEKRRAWRAMMANPDAEEKDVYKLSSEIGTLEGDLAVERMRIAKQLTPVFTPAQAARFRRLDATGGAPPAGKNR